MSHVTYEVQEYSYKIIRYTTFDCLTPYLLQGPSHGVATPGTSAVEGDVYMAEGAEAFERNVEEVCICVFVSQRIFYFHKC